MQESTLAFSVARNAARKLWPGSKAPPVSFAPKRAKNLNFVSFHRLNLPTMRAKTKPGALTLCYAKSKISLYYYSCARRRHHTHCGSRSKRRSERAYERKGRRRLCGAWL